MTPEERSVLQRIQGRRQQVISKGGTDRSQYKSEQEVLSNIEARRSEKIAKADFMETVKIAAKNFNPSAGQAWGDITKMLTDPREAWEGIKSLGSDIAAMNPVFRGEALDAETPSLDAAVEMYKDRYGSWAKAKQTFAKDPVGFFMDASLPFTAGGGALAKAPGIAGKVGRVTAKAGATIDPLNIGLKGAGAVAKATGATGGYFGKQGFGLATGTRPEVIGHAYKSAKTGSPKFRAAMRGDDTLDNILHDVEANVSQMQRAKSAEYQAGMAGVTGKQAKLNFDAVDANMRELNQSLSYKGKAMFDKSELTEVQRIKDLVDDWKSSPEVHDAGGFDALKRRIDQVNISPKDHPNAFRIKTSIRNTIKKTIVDQVPEYARVMKDYEEATGIINEIRKGLALNPNASLDAQLGKLSRLMTRNATEGKTGLLEMADLPGTSISERLAGYQMSTATPKGLTGIMGIPAAGYASLATQSPLPMFGLLAQSPRLVGEATQALGQGSRLVSELTKGIQLSPRALGHTLFQGGRLTEELQKKR